MLSSTATINGYHCLTDDEVPDQGKRARLFGDFICKKVQDIVRSPYDSVQYDSQNENWQFEITKLSRQWRDQEISTIISQICQSCELGRKIAARLDRLRSLVKEEEEGGEADISSDSLRALHTFLYRLGRCRSPEISLTPDSEIYLRWKDGPSRLFAVHFQNDRRVRYTVFSPNPRHPHIVNRLSGMETVDTVLVTADNACSIMKWICR